MAHSRKMIAVLAGLALVAGCGGGDSDDSNVGALEAPEGIHSERKVLAEFGPEHEDGGYRVKGNWCVVSVVLTSANQVEMYAEAGDLVATNPSQTAGVKIGGDNDPFCHRWFTEALADLN